MTARRVGLRFRLIAAVTGPVLLCGSPLIIALLLQTQNEVHAAQVAAVDAALQQRAQALERACGADAGCLRQTAARVGLAWETAPCATAQKGGKLLACTPLAPGWLRGELDLRTAWPKGVPLAPVLTLVALFSALLILLLALVLDRQVVGPLGRIDTALDDISAGSEPLLPGRGDLIGGMGPAVKRLAANLRDERARVQAQIEQLSRSNAELRQAREEVARNERLASVGRLAAGVAHEVGNPMTALIGFVAILQERLRAGKEAGDYVDRIGREAERIDRILRDLLNLARPPPARFEAVDLRALAERMRGLVELQPGWMGARLEIAFPDPFPRARGDDHYVTQVLLNLVVNAGKAGATRVRIVGREEEGAPIVEVEDDGRGLAPGAEDRLFEPFFTTSPPGEGSGLGLALCHATMERLGGSIAAARLAQGTRFTLRFARWEAT